MLYYLHGTLSVMQPLLAFSRAPREGLIFDGLDFLHILIYTSILNVVLLADGVT